MVINPRENIYKWFFSNTKYVACVHEYKESWNCWFSDKDLQIVLIKIIFQQIPSSIDFLSSWTASLLTTASQTALSDEIEATTLCMDKQKFLTLELTTKPNITTIQRSKVKTINCILAEFILYNYGRWMLDILKSQENICRWWKLTKRMSQPEKAQFI